MPSLTLTDFKNRVQDVARPNRFWITVLDLPDWDENLTYACKSVSLPNRTLGNIELNWQGMKTKIAGDPTFDDITFTFLQAYDWSAKDFFEAWMQTIASMHTNVRGQMSDYKAQIKIEHLGRTDQDVLAVYVLEGAYPIAIDAVELNMDSSDTPEEFSVTITYDTFYREDGINGGADIAPNPGSGV